MVGGGIGLAAQGHVLAHVAPLVEVLVQLYLVKQAVDRALTRSFFALLGDGLGDAALHLEQVGVIEELHLGGFVAAEAVPQAQDLFVGKGRLHAHPGAVPLRAGGVAHVAKHGRKRGRGRSQVGGGSGC